ncbi:MAG: methyltransferase [Nocardioidaceae bacterium]|nr:methyltransferase [Nocardioidaceae bacterium]
MSDHYFSADPGSAEKRQPVTVQAWGRELTLDSASGVFARGRLDVGTAVLFREAEPPAGPGTFLDLGCGYGVIACALAHAQPAAAVWAVDVNERALRLCAENASALGITDRLHASLPSDVPDDLTFDQIWSNPPIRIGKPALHELLLRWLPRLAPHGRAVLVVGKNLGADSLQRWITEQGFPCSRIGSAKGFRVLQARYPAGEARGDTSG